MKLDSYPMSLGDTNRETTKLKERERQAKSDAMKWKSRFIQIHNLIAAEKHRKTLAHQNSIVLSNHLPEVPPEEDWGGSNWTKEMALSIQARNEIGSEEFVEMWAKVLQNWQAEDGSDAIVRPSTRPGTNVSYASSFPSTRGSRGKTLGGVLATSESVPVLKSDAERRKKRMVKNQQITKSAPTLPKKEDETGAGITAGEGGNNNQDECGADFVLPMLAPISQHSILDEERKLVKQIAEERKKTDALRKKQLAIAEGQVDVEDVEGMLKDLEAAENGELVLDGDGEGGGGEGEEGDGGDVGGDDLSTVAESLKSVEIMIDKLKSSKRLDIAATGLTKARYPKLGGSSLLSGGETFDLSGGIRNTGDPPRKRLVASLKRYQDPEASSRFRKELQRSIRRGGKGKMVRTPAPKSLW